jgi:hypothetical protein
MSYWGRRYYADKAKVKQAEPEPFFPPANAASVAMGSVLREGFTRGERAHNQAAAPGDGHTEPADELERVARKFGAIDTAAVRALVDDDTLAGAALEARVVNVLRDRDYLAPGIAARLEARANLGGGAGRDVTIETSPPSLGQMMRETVARNRERGTREVEFIRVQEGTAADYRT